MTIPNIKNALDSVLRSSSGSTSRPVVDKHFQSNVPGLYIIGDLAGAPVIKLAMEQGYEVVEHIAALSDARSTKAGAYDLLIVGAGAAGLNAALQARERGLRSLLMEKNKIASTIESFPEGKWVYAEPEGKPVKGKLWLEGSTKEDLIARWRRIIQENHLDVREETPVETIRPDGGHFEIQAGGETFQAKRVILAIGQRGNPRKLGVPGEENENVYHRLYTPGHYKEKEILVVGGGNSAVEAALVLCEQNRVILSYRKHEFSRLFKENRRKLRGALEKGRIQVLYGSNVLSFQSREAHIRMEDGTEKTIPCHHAFILIGAEMPVGFLRSVGVRLENDWPGSLLLALALVVGTLGAAGWLHAALSSASTGATDLFAALQGRADLLALLTIAGGMTLLMILGFKKGDRYAWLAFAFLICYTVYGAKVGKGEEFWPFTGWGYHALSFGGRPWSFWYTVLYTGLMTIFGLQAMKRWGFHRNDRFQIWRYVSLLAFQWIFFFIIPEFLFQWAVHYQWVGEKLATDPNFAGAAWRSYGLVYAWPLFFYTFFYNPHTIWVVWGAVLSFVLIPTLAIWHGKRYCSWICGCGGLAETLGDRWRHLAPKGDRSVRVEWMGSLVLVLAVTITGAVLARDTYVWLQSPSEKALHLYRIVADVWLVGIIPVTLYPFLGGKIWCRYWCPLAKMMHFWSGLWSKLGVGQFKIEANDKCIACGECSRYCQVGIDVMNFALKQETLDNSNSSCIGCGICVTVCPMDTLSFGKEKESATAA